MLRRGGRSWLPASFAASVRSGDRSTESVQAPLPFDVAPAEADGAQDVPIRAAARLRGDEALSLLDASSDAVIGLDAFARVAFANTVAERTFGEHRGGLVGVGVDDLVPHLARAVTSLRLRVEAGDAVPGPAGRGTELAGVRADGSRFPATVWLTPVRRGRRMLIAATVRDLTPQRAADARARRQSAELNRALQQADQTRQQMAAVLRAITERVIVIADAAGVIVAFNRAAERLLGYTAAELIGQPTTRLSDPDELAAVAQELGIDPGLDPLLELTRSGLPNTQDWSYLTNRGERRPVSLRITAVGNRTDPSGFVCVAEDRSNFAWTPVGPPTGHAAGHGGGGSDRLLLDLDDAETRSLRWQVGGSRYARRG
jgi:PAS domain S-box-containing protein